MYNKNKNEGRNARWILSAMSAPIVQIGAGCTWTVVLLTGLLCTAACWILQTMTSACNNDGKWVNLLNLIWAALLISQLCEYPITVWPKNERTPAVPLALLALAAWAVAKGEECSPRAGNGIFWCLFVLYGVVCVSAVKLVRLENLAWKEQAFDPLLGVAFLIPAAITGKEKGSTKGILGSVAFGVLVSVLTIGSLSLKVVKKINVPFYQLSRSISFLGFAERFESIVAAAMMLGYFTCFTVILSSVKRRKEVWLCAVMASATYLYGIQIEKWYLLIGSIFIWFTVPMIKCIFLKINEKRG